ncbi:MAG: hypothetical protein ACK5ST_01895, partial [bacterium]
YHTALTNPKTIPLTGEPRHFKPPLVYYRGNPAELDANRALKLRQARHRRREANLKLKQKTLGLSATESIA